jgi:hypothetical protein
MSASAVYSEGIPIAPDATVHREQGAQNLPTLLVIEAPHVFAPASEAATVKSRLKPRKRTLGLLLVLVPGTAPLPALVSPYLPGGRPRDDSGHPRRHEGDHYRT